MSDGFTLEEACDKVNMPLIAQTILIKECYDQPHRHYHNTDHLREMLKHVPQNHSEVEIIIEAILFHDIVYFPHPTAPGLNEALSIAEYLSYNTKAMAVNTPFGKNDSSFEYERRVIEAINATAHHLKDQQHLGEVSKLVLDLDLATFALPWEEYEIWVAKVEKENLEIYKDKYSPYEIKKGRNDFLQEMLHRKQIYYLKTEWEDRARANLQKDIDNYIQTFLNNL